MKDTESSNQVERAAEQQKSCEQQQLRCVDIIDSYQELNKLRVGTAGGGTDSRQNDDFLTIEKFDDVGSITGSGRGAAGSTDKAPAPMPDGSEAPCTPGGGGGRVEIPNQH